MTNDKIYTIIRHDYNGDGDCYKLDIPVPDGWPNRRP